MKKFVKFIFVSIVLSLVTCQIVYDYFTEGQSGIEVLDNVSSKDRNNFIETVDTVTVRYWRFIGCKC